MSVQTTQWRWIRRLLWPKGTPWGRAAGAHTCLRCWSNRHVAADQQITVLPCTLSHNWHERSANVGISLLTLAIRAYRRELTSTSGRLFLGPRRNVVTAPLDAHPRNGDPPRRIGRKRFPCARGETEDNARARNNVVQLKLKCSKN